MSRQFWKRKSLLAAIETTYGTKATLTAAQGILAMDVSLDVMAGQNIDRNVDLPWLAAQETIPAEVHSKISFKVEMAASGTLGTVPFWGPLLRACGFAQTVASGVSVTYNPISSGFEAVSIDLMIDAVRYQMTGARGTVVFRVDMGIPYLEFQFWGLFTRPDAASFITPTLTAARRPLAAQSVNTPLFTINSVALGARSFVLDAGVSVIPRFTMGVAPEIMITDRAEKLDMTIEARSLATFDPYGLAEAGTLVPIALTHGVTAGQRVKFNAPNAQLLLVGAPANSDGLVVLPLTARPRPSGSGNDQFTIVLD